MTAISSSSLYQDVGLALDPLLAPLAEGDGGGVDIRYDPAFDAVAEARREDIAEGSQGIWQTELKKGDWKAVIRLGTEILATPGPRICKCRYGWFRPWSGCMA